MQMQKLSGKAELCSDILYVQCLIVRGIFLQAGARLRLVSSLLAEPVFTGAVCLSLQDTMLLAAHVRQDVAILKATLVCLSKNLIFVFAFLLFIAGDMEEIVLNNL